MKTRLVALTSILTLFVGACGQNNPRLEPPVRHFSPMEMTADRQQRDLNSKVDILFVIDNSMSMEVHQRNLVKALDGFMSAFSKNEFLDFHAGVVTIWDSRKFTPEGKYRFNEVDRDGKKRAKSLNVEDMLPAGTLLPLKDPRTKAELPGPQRFVTRETPDFAPVLGATIHMGVRKGPEFEELFSPVEQALTNPQILNGPNKGFYRPDAYLLVIFISDADDRTPGLSPDKFYYDLLKLKGGDQNKVMSVAVMAPPNEPQCKNDDAWPPLFVMQFVSQPGGRRMSLCSPNYGQELAEIGIDLSNRMRRQIIPLNGIPDRNSTIEVRYGSQVIPEDPVKGWSYDADGQVVIINPGAELKPEPGAHFEVRFIPGDLLGIKSGHTKRVGTN